MERQRDSGDDPGAGGNVRREYEGSPEYLRNILRYVVEIGASLRLQMDIETLLKRVVTTSCRALRFRSAAIYLADSAGFFRVAATSGVDTVSESALCCHPLSSHVIARAVQDCYRIGDSYFIPDEAALWQDEAFARHFAATRSCADIPHPLVQSTQGCPCAGEWRSNDLLLIPLRDEHEQLLGFLRPAWPLSGLRPTQETASFFELFANQAAVAIEGARLSGELRAAVRQVKEEEQRKNSFLLTASHELRTPLTAIQGYLELLGEYGETLDASSRIRFVQNALRGCDELVLLLGNVLDATYLDVEKITIKAGSVSLSRSIQAILDILEPTIAREKRQIEIQVAPDLLVLADELRLRQILLNLLGNTLKYTPPGSRVVLSTEYVDKDYLRNHCVGRKQAQEQSEAVSGLFVVLTVRDWGPGVAPAEQPLLFTKFTRMEAAKKSSQQGAGLGLYLCRRLIEAMGGWIWMESSGKDGEGACFFVALPISRA